MYYTHKEVNENQELVVKKCEWVVSSIHDVTKILGEYEMYVCLVNEIQNTNMIIAPRDVVVRRKK